MPEETQKCKKHGCSKRTNYESGFCWWHDPALKAERIKVTTKSAEVRIANKKGAKATRGKKKLKPVSVSGAPVADAVTQLSMLLVGLIRKTVRYEIMKRFNGEEE